ncbi:hypothetical protein HDU67_004007, partial [Dinochytrium kinnereticum]
MTTDASITPNSIQTSASTQDATTQGPDDDDDTPLIHIYTRVAMERIRSCTGSESAAHQLPTSDDEKAYVPWWMNLDEDTPASSEGPFLAADRAARESIMQSEWRRQSRSMASTEMCGNISLAQRRGRPTPLITGIPPYIPPADALLSPQDSRPSPVASRGMPSMLFGTSSSAGILDRGNTED